MKLTDDWFTAISESEEGQMVFVTGRLGLDEFRQTRKLSVRIEIEMPYEADEKGLPTEAAAIQLEEVEALLRQAMERDKLAILTGNYTGAAMKYWVFYARTERVFGERLNEALCELPLLPLKISCERDEEWEEYLDMLSMNEGD